MLRFLGALSLFIAAAANHAADGAIPKDELCGRLAIFANNVKESEEITLTTNWSEFAKGCAHGEQPQGKDFCEWLVHNVSTEFMQVNVRRVLACLSPSTTYIPIHASVDYMTGRLRIYDAPLINEGVEMVVEYSIEENEQVHRLSIAAKLEGAH